MRKTLFYLLFPVLWFPALLAQNVDNSYYVRQFPGSTIGEKTTAAQAACNPDTSIPCIIVFDPSLVKWAPGAMPSPCAQCQWLDYRSGAPYIPTGGGTANGLLQLKSTNSPFSLSTSSTGSPINLAPGLFVSPTWNGTTAGPLTFNTTVSGLWLNAVNSRPGVNRGGWALTAPNWTTSQIFAINYDNYAQGLSNGSISQYHRGLGDSLLVYLYDGCNGGNVLPDDEGCGAFSAATGEGAPSQFSAATYTGTVVTGGSGATQLTANCGANCTTQGDGEYLLDLTSAQSDYFTAHSNSSGNTPETITTNGTYTVSTAWGSLVANVNTPTTNPVGTGTVSQTFNVTLTSGTFTVGGLACFAGQMHDQGKVTAVGTPSGGVQSITVTMRQVHYSGSMVYEGGPCGKKIVVTAAIGDGNLKYPVDVLGALGAHTLAVTAFGATPWLPNYVLTNVDMASIGVGSLSNSGTTVTFTFTQGGFVNYAAPFFGASVVTFSGASDSAFNTQCTSLSLNSSTQVATCTIAGLSGTHTAASASVTLGDTGFGNTRFTLYDGAEILDVQDPGAANAVDGKAFALEPNAGSWAGGDSIEAEHLPAQIFFAAKFSVTSHNPGPYVFDGVSSTVSGAGAMSSSGMNPLYGMFDATNTEPWSNYAYFGAGKTAIPLPGVKVTGPNAGINLRDAPCWTCYAFHVGPPHTGVSDAGYYNRWAWDCAAGECGLQFWQATNKFLDYNTSDNWWFYNLHAYTGSQWVTVGTSLGPVYDTGGNQKTVAHTVIGQCTMTAGTCTITFSGAAVFTSSATYQCAPSDTTSAAAVKWSPISATQFSLAGTGGDVVSFICTGN